MKLISWQNISDVSHSWGRFKEKGRMAFELKEKAIEVWLSRISISFYLFLLSVDLIECVSRRCLPKGSVMLCVCQCCVQRRPR